jgi:predicted regulator of Ras-like GTPase activity (Roadblock/LC7/MglB family)
MVKKTQSLQEIAVSATIEEDQPFESLRANLAKINKRKGVLGYILRNASSAIIDLKDSAKVVEYAILSSQALDSSKELSELFKLGPTENIFIKGKNIKALCAIIGENQVAIFMKKDADHIEILKQVST